jgi:PleD family two-component response regulator
MWNISRLSTTVTDILSVTLFSGVLLIGSTLRHDGEVFIVLLPETYGARVSPAIAEPLCGRVRTTLLDTAQGTCPAVPVSVGIAVYPLSTPSRESYGKFPVYTHSLKQAY